MLESADVLNHQLLAFPTVRHFDEIFENIEIQIARLDLEPVRLPRARQPPKRFSSAVPAEAFHPNKNLDRRKSSVDDYAKLLVTMSPEVLSSEFVTRGAWHVSSF